MMSQLNLFHEPAETTKVDLTKVTKDYIRLRNLIAEKEEQHKQDMAPLEEEFEGVSNILLGVCNEQNADSIKTSEGTVSRRVQSRYWASDWEHMHKFIVDNAAPYLLEQRVHNGNMKQFLEEHPDKMPIGLQSTSKYVIQVRKPTAK